MVIFNAKSVYDICGTILTELYKKVKQKNSVMLRKKKSLVGVLIRDNCVRVMQFVHTKKGVVVHASGNTPLPQGIVSNGVINDVERLGTFIYQACSSALPRRIARGAHAVYAIPTTKVLMCDMTLPYASQERIDAVVKQKIGKCTPLVLADVYYDWRYIGSKKCVTHGASNIVVALSAKKIVDGYTTAVERAGLHVHDAEPEVIADVRALFGHDVNSANFVVICDATNTRIFFVTQGIPLFAVTIPIGYQSFITGIVRSLGISVHEAQRVIDADGIGSYIIKDPLFEAIMPELYTLSGEIRKSIKFFFHTHPRYKQKVAMLFGGRGATIKGLRSFFVEEIGLPVYEVNPWRGACYAENTLPPLSRSDALDAMTTIGLALRGSQMQAHKDCH